MCQRTDLQVCTILSMCFIFASLRNADAQPTISRIFCRQFLSIQRRCTITNLSYSGPTIFATTQGFMLYACTCLWQQTDLRVCAVLCMFSFMPQYGTPTHNQQCSVYWSYMLAIIKLYACARLRQRTDVQMCEASCVSCINVCVSGPTHDQQSLVYWLHVRDHQILWCGRLCQRTDVQICKTPCVFFIYASVGNADA